MRLLVLLLVLLPACATTSPSAQNGKADIVWQRIDDAHGACEGLNGRKEFFRILGCSRWSSEKGVRTCTIYAPEPRDERDAQRFATLGHELMHCFDHLPCREPRLRLPA